MAAGAWTVGWGAGGAAATAVPHLPQNLASGSIGLPQLWQNFASNASVGTDIPTIPSSAIRLSCGRSAHVAAQGSGVRSISLSG